MVYTIGAQSAAHHLIMDINAVEIVAVGKSTPMAFLDEVLKLEKK